MSEVCHEMFDNSLSALSHIMLDEMESIKLMNRVDTKYLTDEAHLKEILADAAKIGYRVLEKDGRRTDNYVSIYFDTDDLRMFMDHHNCRLVRQKVRTREYVISGDVFLEIKRKNNKGRTNKKRIEISRNEMMDFHQDDKACDYLAEKSWFHAEQIKPVIETSFTRITLVNAAKTERLTIDTNILFRNFRTERTTSLQDVVIIELKQDGRAESQMKRILINRRVKPMRISKFCVAVTLTDPNVKSGRFKRKIRAIEKIINKRITVQ